jgi:hypothetical protein
MDRIKQKCLKQFSRVRDLISEDDEFENAAIDIDRKLGELT